MSDLNETVDMGGLRDVIPVEQLTGGISFLADF